MSIRTSVTVLVAACFLCACGGGGGSSSSTTTPVSPPTSSSGNVATIVVDSGPSGLGYVSDNVAFVTITVCAPGSTSVCQTIDHILVDTGSVGVRIQAAALSSALLTGLPSQTDSLSRPVGECLQFNSSYVWGSIRKADLQIAGEQSSAIPIQVIGDPGFAGVPSACASSGGTQQNTVASFGANGIIGISAFTDDCGSVCSNGPTSSAGYPYYACTGSSSASCVKIAQGASASAPNQQVPNPVSTFQFDNNGTIITLPSVSSSGQASVAGTLTFGIGTQSNNALGSAQILPLSTTTGYITTVLNGVTANVSYIDSGTSVYSFRDTLITSCVVGHYTFFCPSAPQTLSASLRGTSGPSATVTFTVANAAAMDYNLSVLPQLAMPKLLSSDFAWGLPFFYGRSVYTAISGASTPQGNGPYVAF